ncbi:MAG: GNAT family N-acetyltransferase [Paenibacillus sp. RIFOXYA1_FULL_44_5]|nr:MAG: GNAT family N-acetyltransferase [Paenibacillus sp. RIFOXYA1_FULL_44_5]
MTITCRKAVQQDVDSIFGLIQYYAEKTIMLPRSKELIQLQLDTFVVAETEGKMVGCGSLTRLGKDLVEIRSLGVSHGYQSFGVGSLLVQELTEQAKAQGIPKIMALTYAVPFFEKNGFTVVSKDIFPEKVWKDCMYCTKQHCCDEIAVLKRLSVT